MRIGCLVAYALGIAAFAGLIHGPVAAAAAIVTIALLGLHALELLYAYRFLSRHRGSMGMSAARPPEGARTAADRRRVAL